MHPDDNPRMEPHHSPARTAEEDGRGPLEQRVGWFRIYALVGDLLIDGLEGSGLAAALALPGLASELADEIDEEQLIAERSKLLDHELDLRARALLAAPERAEATLSLAHRALGLRRSDAPGSEHLGHALRLMAALIDAELEALTHDDREDASTLRRLQTRVLDDALLPWMPPLLAALSGQAPSLWTRALAMAARALAEHRATDESLPCRVGGGNVERLDDGRSDIAAVAEALTAPSRCGAYLAPRDLAAVAEACGLQPRAGDRRQTLAEMLASASERGTLSRLTAELGRLLATRDDALATFASEPGLAAQVPSWRRRIAASRRLLDRVSPATEALGRAS